MPDYAQRVLEIYSYFKSEPGDVLLANNLVAVGSRWGWKMDDLQGGVEAAMDRGWVERAQPGWRLTQIGYEAAHEHDVAPSSMQP